MQNSYELLIQKLNAFIREYYKNLIFRGLIYTLLSMCSILILFAIVEHFSFLNGLIRSVLFWTYCITITLVIVKFIVIPGFKMLKLTRGITHEEAAKIIGLHFNEVADKLINILELKNITAGSQDLIHASISQKVKEVQFTPFNKAIEWSKTIYYSKYLAGPIMVVVLFFVSGNKNMLSDSTFRIVNYNSHFEKPAPFYFRLSEDSLTAIEKSNIKINAEVFGEELPQEVFINYNGKSNRMSEISKTSYCYTFMGVENNTRFYLSANDEYSEEYEIKVLGRPEIERISISVAPPRHTKMKTETYINTGSISVPQGSRLTWMIKTEKTDTLKFKIQNKSSILTKQQNSDFKIDKKITTDTKYEITLANSQISFIDTTFYDIKILADSHPIISIDSNSKSTKSIPIIIGNIQDDYGFLKLEAFARLYGVTRDTLIKKTVDIDTELRSQAFISPITDSNLNFSPGETIEFYFIVTDNDAPGGYKDTQSETIMFNAPSVEDIQEDYEAKNELIKNDISAEMSMLKNLEKELTDFEKELIAKDSLDWRDRKKLEEILKQQSSLENKITDLKDSAKANFEQLNSMSLTTPEILKKQEALEKLFNEIMPEEMKDLYKELNDLKDQLNKDELQQKLKDLKLSNEDLEKELDRNLEILKQVEFDQKLETIIEGLKKLKTSQLMLAEKKITEQLELQQEHIEDFQKIKQDILEMKKLNKNLENKKKIADTKSLETDISNELQKGQESLQKNQKKRASKSQKEAGEKLEKMANMFEQMKSEEKEAQHYEDMDVLRQILENLVYFSIEEENLLLAFQELDKNDPQYVELMHEQQALRDAARVIEDSLFALSKRVPQVSSKINREINAIDKKTGSAIDYLRERLTLKAVQDQQFIMTSANNLAVLLSQILEQMQKDLASDLPSTQQCEKPGRGTPKPGDLKKMQQQLSEHLQKMQEEIQKGNKNEMQQGNMSQRLVEMLAKQELIRGSLEELRNNLNDEDGLRALENAIDNMKKTEEDIANKQISLESLSRQKDILTRLLEVESALREQGEDDKRESKTAVTDYERIIQNAYEKYELEKLKQTELLKTTPPQLNEYYKQKVERYFNLMLQ